MTRLFVFLLLTGTLLMPLQARQETGFLNRAVRVKGVAYKYQVYVPAEWNKSKQWPVILFLHGVGERGDDGLAETQVGIGRAIRLHGDRVPAVVVMPQCRKEKWWTQPEMEEMALAALEATVKQFRGDRARLYLTGLSMGGYGTFGLGARQSGKFAALVPICGGVRLPRRPNLPAVEEPAGDPYAATARKIGKTPIWIFHGGADPTVPVTESQKMVEALKAAGADPKYTEYPGVGHNSWDQAYDETELWKWLFEQRLSR
ncbi:MAG: prolyl oligopeptidase family serine peptidase [Acidobacteria bacterium]|nr:prolyl oligopeptidase family serine peptidase [Acidobacteriota bacterium]